MKKVHEKSLSCTSNQCVGGVRVEEVDRHIYEVGYESEICYLVCNRYATIMLGCRLALFDLRKSREEDMEDENQRDDISLEGQNQSRGEPCAMLILFET